jgi:hypothetical protein
MLSKKEINEAFINAKLEENYNFLESDLIRLADAIIKAAKPKMIKEERVACVEVAKSYNNLVADKILEIRSKQ